MQRIGFIGNGVVEEPNKIVRQSRGWEQQETTSIPRAGGLTGRIHVFKTPPVNWVRPQGGGATETLLLLELLLMTERKRGKQPALPLFTLLSFTIASPGSDSTGASWHQSLQDWGPFQQIRGGKGRKWISEGRQVWDKHAHFIFSCKVIWMPQMLKSLKA